MHNRNYRVTGCVLKKDARNGRATGTQTIRDRVAQQDRKLDTACLPKKRQPRRRFRYKRVVVAFPPKRSSTQLKQAASAAFSIFPKRPSE